MQKIAFIIHGGIRKKAYLYGEIRRLFGPGSDYITCETTRQGESEPLAIRSLENGCTHLISVGGDGSLNEVMNGIMAYTAGWKAEQRKEIRVGTLPRGTGNDFARTISAPEDLDKLLTVIQLDQYREIDLGLVQFTDTSESPRTRYFINITDIGIGGLIVEKVHKYVKWPGKAFNYQRAIIASLMIYQHKNVSFKMDGKSFEDRIMSLIIANGKYFGSGLGIAPDAEPDDGFFSIVKLGQVSIWDYIRNLGIIRQCKRVDHPRVKYGRARTVEVQSNSKPLPIDLDGEFIGYTPMYASLMPRAVRFLCVPT